MDLLFIYNRSIYLSIHLYLYLFLFRKVWNFPRGQVFLSKWAAYLHHLHNQQESIQVQQPAIPFCFLSHKSQQVLPISRAKPNNGILFYLIDINDSNNNNNNNDNYNKNKNKDCLSMRKIKIRFKQELPNVGWKMKFKLWRTTQSSKSC